MERYTFHDYLRAAGISDADIAEHQIDDFELAFKPKPHQVEGLKLLLEHRHFGLFDEPGTGKTLQMQALAVLCKYEGSRTAVLMPPVLLDQFNTSIVRTFFGVENKVWIHWLCEGPTKRSGLYAEWDTSPPDILLLSYQMFLKPDVREFVITHYNIFICDEAQHLKGPESEIHNLIKDATEPEYTSLVLATGTPIHNTPEDCYAMCRLINRGVYTDFDHFKKVHQRTRMVKVRVRWRGRNRLLNVNKVIGWKNLKLLGQNLFRNARRVKADAVLDRKKPHVIPVEVSLSKKHLQFYKQFARNRVMENSLGELIDAESAQKLRQDLLRCVVEPWVYEPEIKTSRVLELCDEIVDGMGLTPENKVIVVAYHNSTVEMLAEKYKKYNPAMIYGKITGKRRDKEIRKFKHDKDCLMAVINARAGGAGLDFQDVCSTEILVTPLSVPGDFKQVVGRIDRHGQKHPVKVYVLVARSTVAASLAKSLQEKEELMLATDQTAEALLAEALCVNEADLRKTLKRKA